MTAARRLLCSIVLVAVTAPYSYADACAPVDAAQVGEAARAFLRVPPGVPFELVASERVGTSCYDRLIFETVDSRQIRESVVYVSPDRAYLSREVFAVGDRGTPNAGQADPLTGVSANAPVKGASDARLTLVEFSDFQCPYCRGAASALGELAAADPNVKVVFRHLPLPNHPWALHAARASSCARGESFWKLHDFYFEKQRELTPENVAEKTREYLAGLGSLDLAAFDQCVAGDESLDAVRRDVRAAALLGVTATPTIFANGRRVRGSSLDVLRKEIEAATGIAVRAPRQKATYMVFLRPTGRSSSPELDNSSATFLAQLKKEGELLNAGRAQAADGASAFDILTVRATDASAALKLISRSPLVSGGIVKAEVVEYRPAAEAATP
ncbi:MAG TPA: thioredoxin domain-containing protein [Thermoanaerobaculia bacterium]